MQPKWDLIKRFCACGCGKSFRVLKGSPSYYASIWHEQGTDDYYQGLGEKRPSAGNDFIFRKKNLDPKEILEE